MKGSYIKLFGIAVALMLILLPALPGAAESPPPVASPLVREGAFAVKLADAFGLGAGSDEILAESRLGELGISPHNGWIADYPVTPDIVGELQQSIIDAADSSRLGMNRDEALNIFYDVNMNLGLAVIPDADDSIRRSSSENYPPEAVVNDYYSGYGPPVVTYYAPPPGYMYLYGWVPFPFWYYGFWFPGFYVLHDFHYPVVYGGRTHFVSNHHHDLRYHRSYVVDPVRRFHGGAVYGVGAPRGAHTVYRGNPRIAHEVLNSRRDRMIRAARTPQAGRIMAPARSTGAGTQAPVNRRMTAPSRDRSALQPAQDGKIAAPARPLVKSYPAVQEKTTVRQVRDRKDTAQPRPAVRNTVAPQVMTYRPPVQDRKAVVPAQNNSAPRAGSNSPVGNARFQNGANRVQPVNAAASGRAASQPSRNKVMTPGQSIKGAGPAFQPQHRGGGLERGNIERGGRGERG